MRYYKVSFLSIIEENKIQEGGLRLLESATSKTIKDFEIYFDKYHAGNGIAYILTIDIITEDVYNELGGGTEIK